MSKHLAIDIGASSGRHILGFYENGKLEIKEVYRFENGLQNINGSLCWDIESLLNEVKNGIKACKEQGYTPDTIAIDTWGVDYVLIDEKDDEIMPAYAYRDERTYAVIDEVESIIPPYELYSKTGEQKQAFNTIYQLYCDKKAGRLDKAAHFLMMPAYLSYKLTGVAKNEYTLATTGALVNAKTKEWDMEVISKLGLPEKLFDKLALPAEYIGNLTKEMRDFVGFDAAVVCAPSHDTAAAVAACPLEEDGMYISSGTWSLIGAENTEAILTEKACEFNFANEGGVDYRFRFLKNYMGMWLIQNIRRNINKEKTYDEMMFLAKESDFVEYIDVNDKSFVAPENMIEAIRTYLGKKDLPLGDVLNSVYHSLAKSYVTAVREMEDLTGKTIKKINIVGGGCADKYLNELTAKYTGKPVVAGPKEATAIGNLIIQAIYSNPELDLEFMRKVVKTSFDIEEVR